MNSIHEKILREAELNVQRKIEQETEIVKRKALADKEVIEKALEMIEKRLLFKKKKTTYGHSIYEYTLATEDMFLEDYMKKPEYGWQAGVRFVEVQKDTREYAYRGVFNVNGETYFDFRFCLANYENDLKDVLNRLNHQDEVLRKIRDEYEDLLGEQPRIKKMIEDWNKIQNGQEGEG